MADRHTPRNLKPLLSGSSGIHVPGTYDAFSSLMAEQAGFEAVYLSGASIAYTSLGRPDVGLVSMTEVADIVARVRDRIAIPIIVDADTGYGNAINVQRTVRIFERSGANAIQLEDQTSPKRCGHLKDKSIVSAGQMVGKIKAALDARASAETLIIARTDAIAMDGFAAALDRAGAYRDAGADVLFIEAPQSIDDMRAMCDAFAEHTPLVANMVEGGSTPMLDRKTLSEMGFRLIISPGALMRAITPVMEAFLRHLREHGSTTALRADMLDLMSLNQRLDLTGLLELGASYDSK